MPFNYSIIFYILGTISFIISIKLFPHNIGELWCYIASCVPILLLIASYII